MNIQLVTPAPLGLNNGNHFTAVRWASILKQLGHRVTITRAYDGARCDALVALHARRSHASIRRFHERHPVLPLIVALTGTDLYRDIHRKTSARESLAIATRLIVLQKMALAELTAPLRAKTHVIYQSAAPVKAKRPPWNAGVFNVVVVGHLRSEKDPLRAALASRQLPDFSRVRVTHIGRALEPSFQRRAREETTRNPRYRWLGELPHPRTRRLLAATHALVITSRMEGSSNVLSEALASGVPVIASAIPGLIGTLGKDYPGLFSCGDTGALAALLQRAETDPTFYGKLVSSCKRLARLVSPRRELAAWRRLLREIN